MLRPAPKSGSESCRAPAISSQPPSLPQAMRRRGERSPTLLSGRRSLAHPSPPTSWSRGRDLMFASDRPPLLRPCATQSGAERPFRHEGGASQAPAARRPGSRILTRRCQQISPPTFTSLRLGSGRERVGTRWSGWWSATVA